MHRTATPRLGNLLKTGLYLCLACSALIAGCQSRQLYEQQFLQFGTLIDISLITSKPERAEDSFNEIESLLKKRHLDWHPWEKGDLGLFNQALHNHPDRGTNIPDSLKYLVNVSKQYFQLTDGIFNPALGQLISAWGFHLTPDPDYELIDRINKNLPSMNDLVIQGNQAYSSNPFLRLDFGAVAKGQAVKQIAELLNHHSMHDFIINAGGDIYASGQNLNRPWRVAIENPFQPGVIADLELTSGLSIFTSGNYHRHYTDKENILRHHIIDPKTGEPSLRISSATVIHADPVIADIAATTLMLTSPSEIAVITEKLGITDFLIITEQKDIYINRQLVSQLNWRKPEDFTLHAL